MSFQSLKKPTFWFGFILLFIPFIAPIFLPNNSYIIIIISIIFSLSYYLNYILVEQNNQKEKRLLREQQINESKKYYFSKNKENIEKILSFAEIVNNFYDDNAKQRIRSNIFLKDFNGYRIYAQYNMSRLSDYKVYIPENKGVTGEAWLTKNQVWANQDQIFQGVYRLPIEEREKLTKDLQWLCSTPILVTNSNGISETIAVFNIDGNKAVDDEALKKRIQETGIMIVDILEKYDLDCLREPSVAN